MPIRRALRLVIGPALLAAALAGCKHYWGKPGATAEDFNRDNVECAKEAVPTAKLATYGVDSEKMYKACMRAHGWAREQKQDPPGEGWFRGIEDWD